MSVVEKNFIPGSLPETSEEYEDRARVIEHMVLYHERVAEDFARYARKMLGRKPTQPFGWSMAVLAAHLKMPEARIARCLAILVYEGRVAALPAGTRKLDYYVPLTVEEQEEFKRQKREANKAKMYNFAEIRAARKVKCSSRVQLKPRKERK
jgi:hypothetical protein